MPGHPGRDCDAFDSRLRGGPQAVLRVLDGHAFAGPQAEAVERELRLAGLRAERETYYRLGRERKLSDDIVRRLVAEVDHAETRLG